jgi:hypothetical protein
MVVDFFSGGVGRVCGEVERENTVAVTDLYYGKS